MAARKVLMVGPYPPPQGGWSTWIREEREELESRDIRCRVLNIGENRKTRRQEYICVHNGPDLLLKLVRYGLAGYLFRLHMNGDSIKGMMIVLISSMIGILCFRRPCLSFHAGISQRYFPHRGKLLLDIVWRIVFGMQKIVLCDNDEVAGMISSYRWRGRGVYGISPFSIRRVTYEPVELGPDREAFLSAHGPVLFSYFAYRPEYKIEMLFEALQHLREHYGSIGLIAVDDRSHPHSGLAEVILLYLKEKQLEDAVMMTGGIGRDEFLTLMSRADIHVRTPLTDGVCSSVLESLYLGMPVVAADNGSRPEGVITYEGASIEDMVSKIARAIDNLEVLKGSAGENAAAVEDGVGRLADILEEECGL